MARQTQRTAAVRTAVVRAAALAVAVSAGVARADLAFNVSATGWPDAARRTAAVNAMTSVLNRFNSYGDFTLNNDGNVDVVYNAGVATADSTYGGQIRFGGTYPADRVAQHELNHWLGSGTYSNWYNLFNASGVWTGSHMAQLIQQFDGDGAVVQQSGVHFYNYGLNYDTEVVNNNVYMRNVALVYAMRQDMGNGKQANPWSATTATLTGSDLVGTSAFNWFGGGLTSTAAGTYAGWSDKYFAHAGAVYATGDYTLRTPLNGVDAAATTPNFTFAGDALTINNANGINGGLLFKGVGSTGVLTIKNLVLSGGYVRHASGAGDLFQLAGNVTLAGGTTSTIHAAQGNINVLSTVGGAGSLTVPAASYAVTATAAGNNFTGGLNVAGKLTLANAGTMTSVTVAGGGTLAARGNLSTGGTLASSGTIDMVDAAATTFSANTLSLSGSTLNLQLGGASAADRLVAGGLATVGGTNTINLSVLPGQSVSGGGSYTLITAAGGLNLANFTLGTKSLGFYTADLSAPAGKSLLVSITGNPAPATAYWTGAGSVAAGDATYSWGSGAAQNVSNWSTTADGANDPKQVPGGVSDVIFSAANATQSGGVTTSQLEAGYSVKSLAFAVTNAAVTSAVVNTNGNTLEVGGGGITLGPASTAGGTVSGTGTVAVNGSQTWANNSNTRGLTVGTGVTASSNATILTLGGTGTGGVTLGGTVADGNGTLALTFNQAGTTTVTGANTYTGGTTVAGGMVDVTGTGHLGTGGVSVTGGTLRLTGAADAIDNAAALTLAAGATLDLRAAANTAAAETVGTLGGAGTITRSTAGLSTLTVNSAASSTFAGTIGDGSGTVALVKGGAGTLGLSGNNAYSGGTSLNDNGGVLLVTSGAALGTGPLTIGNGDSNRTGKLQLAGNVTLGVSAINVAGRSTVDANYAAIENVSGNNTVTPAITFSNTGGNSVNVLSTAGSLTLGGNLTATTVTGARYFTFYGAGNGTVAGMISNGSATLGVQKSGTGTWTLAGTNAYTGATTVSAGTLLVNGDSSAATGAVTVGNGGTLGGSGTVGGATTIAAGGVLSPGNSPGVLSFSNSGTALTLAGGSTSNFEIVGVARGAEYDGVNINNATGTALVYGGTLNVTFASAVANGAVLDLFQFAGLSGGNFDAIKIGGVYGASLTNTAGVWTGSDGAHTYAFSQATGDLVLGPSTATPEPASLAVLGLAATGLLRRRATASRGA